VYALEAGKRIATFRQSEPAVVIGLRWRPARKGVPGNDKADECAKLAVDNPDAHGVEFLGFGDRHRRRRLPSRTLAHLKRAITETKWEEAKAWADIKFTHKKYQYSRKAHQKPNFTPANADKRLGSTG